MPSLDLPSWLVDLAQIINAVAVTILAVITWRYAKAAKRQADAADETPGSLRQQLAEQKEIGRMIVANAIQSASGKINFWRNANIEKLANYNQLPQTINLVPDQAGSALEYAARTSKEAAAELRSAFDLLIIAQTELEILRGGTDERNHYAASVQRRLHEAQATIDSAETRLRTK